MRTRRPGPPLVVAIVLGIVILALPVAGIVLAPALRPEPAECFEACGLINWITTGFAVILLLSALTNLGLTMALRGGSLPPASLPSLTIVVGWQGGVILAGGVWLWGITTWMVVEILGGFALAIASVMVCAYASVALGVTNRIRRR
ncbi:MAG TPA: hypothetical protein VL294_05645 [Pseudolysinimonas sp.]|jgi:hypothetical protein|nr:hypothetical protein [Pseudolysinimonas sp.]